VTLLRDGPAVFEAWLADIAAAQRFILFENYIFHSDHIGERLANALIERAEAGVQVHVLYDWLGSLGTSHAMWRRMARAGIKVRAFRPLHLTDPVQFLKRDHRKLMCIDGTIAHVGGLCVGDAWAGDLAHGVPPWRDTAVRIHGPAAAALCATFDETWSEVGPSLPPRMHSPPPQPEPVPASSHLPAHEDSPCAGAPVRVVSGSPGRSRIYRLTQALLARAASRIWITDAYFLTPPTIYEALLVAARDGVDVRILVPGRSDLPWISWLGRSGYAGLLEAGVRVFEWEGPMLHAKTTVVDGLFCRIGSSNLNLASLLTNWELDVLIEDTGFAAAMEKMFLTDLGNSRELMLRAHRTRARVLPTPAGPEVVAEPKPAHRPAKTFPGPPKGRPVRGRARAAVAHAGAAVLGVALRRRFEPSAWTLSLVGGLLLLAIGAIGLRWSLQLGMLGAVACVGLGLASLLHALANYLRHRRRHHHHKRARRKRASPTASGEHAPTHEPHEGDEPAASGEHAPTRERHKRDEPAASGEQPASRA
jgi:cardiolipin synthase